MRTYVFTFLSHPLFSLSLAHTQVLLDLSRIHVLPWLSTGSLQRAYAWPLPLMLRVPVLRLLLRLPLFALACAHVRVFFLLTCAVTVRDNATVRIA